MDPDMNDVPRDMQTIGEIVTAGDHVMEGYFREPDVTASVMSGRWFHTGDMAVWDEDSFIHIVDRKKEIIISGGENISSLEVEKAIFAHPEVYRMRGGGRAGRDLGRDSGRGGGAQARFDARLPKLCWNS